MAAHSGVQTILLNPSVAPELYWIGNDQSGTFSCRDITRRKLIFPVPLKSLMRTVNLTVPHTKQSVLRFSCEVAEGPARHYF